MFLITSDDDYKHDKGLLINMMLIDDDDKWDKDNDNNSKCNDFDDRL